MKLTSLTSALVATLVLALSCGSVHAQADSNGMMAPAATNSSSSMTSSSTMTSTSSMKKMPYKGTIMAMDTSANTITVKGSKKTMTLMVTGDTKFKGASGMSDFKVGDMVSGSYMKDASGSMTAASVHKKMMAQ